MTSHDQARDVADRTVGATLLELQDRIDAAQHDINVWIAVYDAALMQANEHPIEPLLTVKEAAAILNCSRSTVYDMIASGRLPVVEGLGGMCRIRRADLARLIDGSVQHGSRKEGVMPG